MKTSDQETGAVSHSRVEKVSRWDDVKVVMAMIVITLIAVVVVGVKTSIEYEQVDTNIIHECSDNIHSRMTFKIQLFNLWLNRRIQTWKLLEMDSSHAKGNFEGIFSST